MKSPLLTGILLLAAGAVAHAQLSFLPQVGFEQARTRLNYNALSASGTQGNFRANLRMDYRFKGGHGPMINLGTSPAPILFAFNNEGELLNGYQPEKSNLRFRMEAGYQYTSKAINLKKGAVSKSKVSETTAKSTVKSKSCGAAVYRSQCGAKKSSISSVPRVNKSLNMRLQPSLALAYIPANSESIEQTANGFTYDATGWKTAIVPAMGFEFAKGRQRLFTLAVFYTKPLGMNSVSHTTFVNNKPVTTSLNPKAATWGMTVGVPFGTAKKPAVKVQEVKKEVNQNSYKRCIRM